MHRRTTTRARRRRPIGAAAVRRACGATAARRALVAVTASFAFGALTGPIAAQTFSLVNDGANPIVTDVGLGSKYYGTAWVDYDNDGDVDL